MHHHLYIIGVHTKKPLSLDNFQPFVHQRSRVDSHLATHAPIRVFERLLQGDTCQLFALLSTERTAAGGEQYLVHRAALPY